jgi:hypothetical protein
MGMVDAIEGDGKVLDLLNHLHEVNVEDVMKISMD